MKTKLLVAAALLGAATLSTRAGVAVTIGIPVPPPPPIVVPPPPPVVVAPVPDSYVWDGTEYVGVVGGQYYYLGPGNVWLTFGPDQFARFNGWQRGHPDWRSHTIHNDRYRGDAHARPQSMGHDRPMDRPQRGYGRDRDDHH